MTKKKMMMAGMSTALVAVIGVGGTLAYLSAQSDVVENTFAVGAGFVPGPDGSKGVILDETKVDAITGEAITGENGEAVRTIRNDYSDLLPNDERLKDPTVWMIGGSVDSYVFVKVEGADDLAAQGVRISDMNWDDWKRVDGEVSLDNPFDGIYQYVGSKFSEDGIVDVSEEVYGEKVELSKVFEHIQVSENLTQEDLENLKGNLDHLALQAVAVQADNNTAEGALEEAKNVAQW